MNFDGDPGRTSSLGCPERQHSAGATATPIPSRHRGSGNDVEAGLVVACSNLRLIIALCHRSRWRQHDDLDTSAALSARRSFNRARRPRD